MVGGKPAWRRGKQHKPVPPTPNVSSPILGGCQGLGGGGAHPFVANPALDFASAGWQQAPLEPHPIPGHLLGPPTHIYTPPPK